MSTNIPTNTANTDITALLDGFKSEGCHIIAHRFTSKDNNHTGRLFCSFEHNGNHIKVCIDYDHALKFYAIEKLSISTPEMRKNPTSEKFIDLPKDLVSEINMYLEAHIDFSGFIKPSHNFVEPSHTASTIADLANTYSYIL